MLLRSLGSILVLATCASAAEEEFTVVGAQDQNSKCEALGEYHSLHSQGVINLSVNQTAACNLTCPAMEQVACRGGGDTACQSQRITNATCILQEHLTMVYFDCVFLNDKGMAVPVAGYQLELERAPEDKRCVLNDSYHVWYTLDFARRDRWLILLGISLGVGSMAFVGLLCLCCCLCWNRRKPREERLIYSPSHHREFY